MHAGFYRDGHAAFARIAYQGQSLRRSQVHDVDRRVEFLRKTNEQGNRFELRFVRPRGKVSGISAPVRVACIERCSCLINRTGYLGVGQQWKAGAPQLRKRRSQVGFIDSLKAVDSGVDEEAFEAGNACVGERKQGIGVTGNHAAPGSPVDPGVAVCGGALGFKCLYIRCFRDAVQGHVDERGDAARGRSLCGC